MLQAMFAVWHKTPPQGTSINHIWGCLKDQGLAFTPGISKKGATNKNKRIKA